MSREIDRKIATELLGYEVQESPRGVLYIHHETNTWPLPDYATDLAAIESACDAWCMEGEGRWFQVCRSSTRLRDYTAMLFSPGKLYNASGPTMAAALYNALTKALGI